MSTTLLALALLNSSAATALSLWLHSRYRVSLTTVDEKRAGFVFYYHQILGRTHPGPAITQVAAAVHYVTLHLLVPLWGFGFFLRTDGNFLVVLVGAAVSVQVAHRLYPGGKDRGKPDD